MPRTRPGIRPTSALLAGGFISVAVSGALLLAVGPRHLSPFTFSGLSLVWTASVIFGLGVATPTEQLISRRSNAGARSSGRTPEWWLAAAGVVAVVLGLCVLSSPFGVRYPLVGWTPVAVAGWVLLAPVRGRLLGQRNVRGYAWVLLAESLSRSALIAAGAFFPAAWAGLLVASVGAPLFLAAALGHLLRHQGEPVDGRSDAPAYEHASFVAIALAYQVCLNFPPIALSWRVSRAHADQVGAFVLANSWFRAPTILIGAITVSALVELSRAYGAGSGPAFRSEVARSGRALVTLTVLAVVICMAVAEPVLRLLYGGPVSLPAGAFLSLAVSTVLAAVSSWLAVPLMAVGRAASAAAVWAAGAVAMLLGLALLPVHLILTVGLVAPVLLTTLTLAILARGTVARMTQATTPGS